MKMVNMDGRYNIVDLFCGVGGLSLGFNLNGYKTIFANDIDKDASNTFKLNHPDVPFLQRDIAKIVTEEILQIIGNNKVHVLMAGIPCQSFSMSGYRIRKGIDNSEDPRHFLYREFFRIMDILQPDVVLIENVKGILSSHSGAIVKDIKYSLNERQYFCQHRLLNASQYGVPQIRERVFIIGNKLGESIIFPKKQCRQIPVSVVLNNIDKQLHNNEKRYLTGITLQRMKLIKPGENWRKLPKELQTKSIHSGAYGRIDPNKPSRTLTTRFDSPPVGYVTHPLENRTLTVREGARIQTFPDDFIFTGKRMQQYKQVGNAVPVKLSYEVSKGIKVMLDTFYENQQMSFENKAF